MESSTELPNFGSDKQEDSEKMLNGYEKKVEFETMLLLTSKLWTYQIVWIQLD